MNDLNDLMIQNIERRIEQLRSALDGGKHLGDGAGIVGHRIKLLQQEQAIRQGLSTADDQGTKADAEDDLARYRADTCEGDEDGEVLEKCGPKSAFVLVIHKDEGTTPLHTAIAGANCTLAFGGGATVKKVVPADGKIKRKPAPTASTADLTITHELPVKGAKKKASGSGKAVKMSLGLFTKGETKYSLELDLVHEEWKTPAQNVVGAQCRLANLGIYSGPIDGAMTWRTKEAIAYFQRTRDIKGIRESGALDEKTLAQLEREHAC